VVSMKKPITIIRYDSLKECFLSFIEGDEVGDNDYWEGYDGGRKFRVNVKKWLNKCKRKCWGWADYKPKTIHIWVDIDCPIEDSIEMLAHESAHLRRPRYKNKMEEEKKANRSGEDAKFAYNAAIDIDRWTI